MFRQIVFSTLLAFVLAQDPPVEFPQGEPVPASALGQKNNLKEVAEPVDESTGSPAVVLKSYGVANPVPVPAYAPSGSVRYVPRFPAYPFYPHRHHSRRSSSSDSDSRDGRRKKCDQCRKLRTSCEGQDEDLCKKPKILHFEHRGCKRAVVSCGREGFQLFNEEDELIGASFAGDFLFSCHKKNWRSGDVSAKKLYCVKIEE